MIKRVSRSSFQLFLHFIKNITAPLLLLISIAVTTSDCPLFHGVITEQSPLDPGRL